MEAPTVPQYRVLEFTYGPKFEEKTYRISARDGVPFRVETAFGGYRGHVTYREVKPGKSTWKRALRAAGFSPATPSTAATPQP